MLFVLRLLPPTKKLQQNVIFVTFFLNFAITMIATVSYSIKCVPFQAIYKTVPNAKCLSENVLTTTQYVNAGKFISFIEIRAILRFTASVYSL